MSQTYWAQPDWQRLTGPHRNFERSNEGSFRKAHSVNQGKQMDPERLEDIRAYLSTGPKTSTELRERFGWNNADIKMCNPSLILPIYEYKRWNKTGKITCYGLLDIDFTLCNN